MGKVFTITEGLENMGALKTGGQGSVYKGRRIGEIITAVKLLPTPIHTESTDDKNYNDFQNEVNKLKRVNENPNPHVVKILSSGMTESGNFPFIEMEFIEGPDLEELLRPPHDPVFCIKEVIKIVDQLSQALEHCHKVEVRHGDIKSNNVKFNINTGNYVLLDFGLAIMSDEQRRTSLRHAGAIEFMAPEQNEGQMLYETDVYSFGVVMYELLAGIVPFPLQDKGETARNRVMLSHMELAPPDLLEVRRQHLPAEWNEEKKEREMNVPMWLVNMVYKCLEKNPENRFQTGIELHEYVALNSTLYNNKVELTGSDLSILQKENEKLLREKSQLQTKVAQYQQVSEKSVGEIVTLKEQLQGKDSEISELKSRPPVLAAAPAERGVGVIEKQSVSKRAFYALLIVAICMAALAAYSLISRGGDKGKNILYGADTTVSADSATVIGGGEQKLDENEKEREAEEPVKTARQKADSARQAQRQQQKLEEATKKGNTSDTTEVSETEETETGGNTQTATQPTPAEEQPKEYYTVISKAHFHDKPDPDTKRDAAFIVHWNNAKLVPLDEANGFIYVIFKNHLGQASKGWLRKSDLKLVGQ